MTIDEAITSGEADFAEIISRLSVNGELDVRVSSKATVCLVDGSMYSPSWRALPNGATVWDHLYGTDGDVDDAAYDVSEAYVETLDRLTDDWSGPDGETLGWEDGCLFLYAADFDHEAL